MQNLLDNAVRHTLEHGQVNVRVADTPTRSCLK